MILTALRYRGPSDKEFRTWRFTVGVGAFRNFISFHVQNENLPEVVAALDYALTGQLSPRIVEVAAQLSDSGGETWIIQRAGRQVRYLRNNQPVTESEAQISMLAAVLDFGVSGAVAGIKSTSEEKDGPARPENNPHIRAIHSTPRGLMTSPFNELLGPGDRALPGAAFKEVDKSAAACAEECSRIFREPKFLKPAFTVKIAAQLQSVSEKYSEYRDQLRELTQEDKSATPDIQKRIDHLAPELELLTEMEETAAPLLDPSQSAQVLKDSLEKVESELTDSLAAFGIDAVPTGPKALDWRKPIDALCRYQIQKQLVAVSEGAVNTLRERMEPTWQEYFSLLQNAVTRDIELTSELESCVTSLQVRTREAERQSTPPVPSRRPSPLHFAWSWFERFKNDSRKSRQNHEGDSRDPISAQSRLDTARMALDLSISRLGVLRAQLDHVSAEHPGSLTEITDQHERLVAEFGRAKERWCALAKEYKIPEDIQIASLTAIVARYATLSALSDDRDSLRKKIRERKSRLTRLESLIVSWRQHTGSQRSVDLTNSQILLSETRSILRYREEKQELYKRLLASAETNRNTHAVKAHLDVRKTKLLGDWRRIFTEAGITPVRMGDERLSTLFDRATTIKGLMHLDATLLQEMPASIFDAAPVGLPICIYVWNESDTTPRLREMLVQQIERASGPQFNIVVISDEALADGLAARGLGRAYRVESNRPVRPASSPVIVASEAPAAPAPKTMISGRAKAALEILTSRRQ